MSKEDVIDYVMTTPGNPNRAVLSGMLDSIAESGGSTVEVVKIAAVQDAQTQAVTVNACDTTFADLAAKMSDGKYIIARLSLDVQYNGASTAKHLIMIPLNTYIYEGSGQGVEGTLTKARGSGAKFCDSVKVRFTSANEMPTVTTFANNFAS